MRLIRDSYRILRENYKFYIAVWIIIVMLSACSHILPAIDHPTIAPTLAINTAKPDPLSGWSCPGVKDYSRAQQQVLADFRARLPHDAQGELARSVLNDWARMRAALRNCPVRP